MKDTIAEQILSEHLVEGKIEEGSEIGLTIDQTLTQDATGTMVYLEFESLGISAVKPQTAVSYVDHNIIQTDSRNADDHRFLQSCAAKFGLVFSPPGNGVSHHVHRQRFGIPGQTLLGSDSHTTTGGCIGMLAMGAGGVEVAMAMAGHPYYVETPKVWGIYVEGEFEPFVSGKDLILYLLGTYSCKAGTGKIMEFFGPGVKNIDMSARATIANMSVDMGSTAAIFPSDEETKLFLAQNDREHDWCELKAGPNPKWSELTEIDLGQIEPMIACPSNPDNVTRVCELSDIEVQQVIIGSSCNGSYRDFMIAAKIMEGKTRNPNVSFEINTGSRQTLDNVLAAGGITALVEAGARVHESGCLGCIGMGQAPATGTVSLRTFPRNFKGRSGTRDDQVYLCSPETAAASALTGRITDPRTLSEVPEIPYPEKFKFKSEWFVEPPADPASVDIVRGPNIKPLPDFPPLADTLEGTVLIKVGDNISTDIIMPAGNRVLPYRSNIPAISDFVFEIIDPEFPARAKEHAGGIVIGGDNYGQGSSREHAALAPRYLGVRAKIVKSFARIHKANLVNFGILPLVFADPADYESIEQGNKISIPGIAKAVADGSSEIPVLVEGRQVMTRLNVSDRQRKILLAGGILNQAKQQG
ncbi:MAG: aconitate hydratase [Planctomycetes bacterium B3_Pla]|nr:MAG: aconitate hydratase [Planctomycetes bacterium B3_Pla]